MLSMDFYGSSCDQILLQQHERTHGIENTENCENNSSIPIFGRYSLLISYINRGIEYIYGQQHVTKYDHSCGSRPRH